MLVYDTGYLSMGSSNWSNIVLHCLDNFTIGKVSSNMRQWSRWQKCLTCSWFCCAISNQKNFVSRPTTSCYFRNTSFNGNWNIMDTFLKRNGLLMIIHIWALLSLRAPREKMRILSGIMNKTSIGNIDLWFSICTTYKLGGTQVPHPHQIVKIKFLQKNFFWHCCCYFSGVWLASQKAHHALFLQISVYYI